MMELQEQQRFQTRQKAHGTQTQIHKFSLARTGPQYSRTGCCLFVTCPCHKPKDRGSCGLYESTPSGVGFPVALS